MEKRLKSINSQAPVQRCTKAEVSPDWVLDIGAFDLKRVIEMDPEFLNTNGEHEHDTSVSSVALTEESTPLDLAAIEDWIGGMLKTQGADIYRMKGVLHIAHAEQRFVYHAVHMIFNGDFTEPWEEDEPRESKLVFIGKNLDAAELKARFEACLATPANLEKKLQALRFHVGDRVMCHLAGDPDADANGYVKGTITQLMWRSEDMDPGGRARDAARRPLARHSPRAPAGAPPSPHLASRSPARHGCALPGLRPPPSPPAS